MSEKNKRGIKMMSVCFCFLFFSLHGKDWELQYEESRYRNFWELQKLKEKRLLHLEKNKADYKNFKLERQKKYEQARLAEIKRKASPKGSLENSDEHKKHLQLEGQYLSIRSKQQTLEQKRQEAIKRAKNKNFQIPGHKEFGYSE